MTDLRLYYYDSGQLKKWSNLKNEYYFTDIEKVREFIKLRNEKSPTIRGVKHQYQWLIVDYEPFYSKIIEII